MAQEFVNAGLALMSKVVVSEVVVVVPAVNSTLGTIENGEESVLEARNTDLIGRRREAGGLMWIRHVRDIPPSRLDCYRTLWQAFGPSCGTLVRHHRSYWVGKPS